MKKTKTQFSDEISQIEYNSDLKFWQVKPKLADQEKVSSSIESTFSNISETSSSEESPARSVERTPLKTPEKSPDSPTQKADAHGIIQNYYDLENSSEGQMQQLRMNQFLRYTGQFATFQGIELLSQKDSQNTTPLYGEREIVKFIHRMPD